MSYRDGHFRARLDAHLHPLDLPYATLTDALAGAGRLSVVYGGRVWVERDGETQGSVLTRAVSTAHRLLVADKDGQP